MAEAVDQAIAIVGFSFKLPQDTVNESKFWEILADRRNVSTSWPAERVSVDGFHDGGSNEPNALSGTGGHFVREDPGVFDAPFFGITAREAAAMDPKQRWALESAFHAFENAGIPLEKLRGSRTAVFAASMTDDYSFMQAKDPDMMPRTAATGIQASILPTRVSWFYDLRGPSVHIDTACSGSMVALDMACQALRSGDANAALVMGCNVLLGPDMSLCLSNMGFLSPDNRCSSFDTRGNGYGRGEGIVSLIIRPLKDALAHGDVIRAIIRMTGSNQDGRTPGITQPSAAMQEELIRHVYAKAELSLADTRYFEAHGTGTATGDPIELTAISKAFRAYRSLENPLYVGSVKANLGHLEGSSGLAGVIKAILILEKGIIPPNALFEAMVSYPYDENTLVEVPTRCINWPTPGRRRISVNSFGFGGTNSHIILDDALHFLQEHSLTGIHHTVGSPFSETKTSDYQINGASYEITKDPSDEQNCDEQPRLLIWSGRDKSSTDRMLQAFEAYFADHIAGNGAKVSQLAYTLAARRSVLAWRSFAVPVAGEIDGLPNCSLRATKPSRSSTEQLGAGFIFTGQGAQYPAMGTDLLIYPTFVESLKRSDAILRSLGCEWSLFDKLQKSEDIDSPDLSQPLCTVLQIALVDLLSSLGVESVAVIGHSSGEIAAGYAAGALSHHSACKVAYFRGKLAARLRLSIFSGTMLSANLSPSDVDANLESSGMRQDNTIHVACVNSPKNVTLSGTTDDIENFRAYLDEQEIFSRVINTGIAYHSPAMHAIAEEYAALLDPLEAGVPDVEDNTIHIFSSVTGATIERKIMVDPKYWVRNLVSTVHFAEALSSLVTSSSTGPLHGRVTDLIEIGPHGALQRPIKDTLSSTPSSLKTASALRYHSILQRKKSSLVTTLELIGSLFCLGFSVSVLAANRQTLQAKSGFLVDCPSYPFDHSRRYWSESRISKDFRLRPHSPGYLLGKRANDHNVLRPRWRNWLSTERFPWLADHAVSGDTVCPGSGMLVMALEAVRQVASETSRPLAGFRIKEAQFLAPIKVGKTLEDAIETEVHLRATQKAFEKETSRFEVTIFTHRDARWTQCFRADMQVEYEFTPISGDRPFALGVKSERDIDHDRIRQLVKSATESCTRPIDTGLFYKFCEERGVRFGTAFQLLKDIHWDGSDVSVASLDIPPRSVVSKLQSGESPVHPTALDAAVHLIFTQFTKGINPSVQSATLIPQNLTNAWISAKTWDHSTTKSSWVRLSSLMRRQSNRAMSVDGAFYVLAEDQSVLCAMENMTLTEVSRPSRDVDNAFDHGLLYSIAWKPLLSALGPDQLRDIFKTKPDESSTEIARNYYSNIELGMLMAGFQAVQEVPHIILQKTPSHLRSFASAIHRLYEKHQSQGGSCLSAAQVEEILDHCDADVPELHLFSKVARSLPLILRGEINPLDILFESQAAKHFYSRMFQENTRDGRLEKFLELKSHEVPSLKIIEVGAGTGGFTQHIFEALGRLEEASGASRYSEYIYSDISSSYFEGARSTFGHQLGRMKFTTFDVEKDPSRLGGIWGDALGTFDLVVAGSALHATSSLERTLKNLRKLLRPGGHLVLFEITAAESACINIAFGSLEGWWLSEEDWRSHGPLVNEERWGTLLRRTGFSGLDLTLKDHENDDCHLSSIIISTAVDDAIVEAGVAATMITDDSKSAIVTPGSPAIRVLLDPDCELQQSFAARIKKRHSKAKIHHWQSIESVHEDMDISTKDVVVSLLDIGGRLLAEMSEPEFRLLQRHVQCAQQLLWISSTHDTKFKSVGDEENAVMRPYHATCTGFMRAIRSEDVGKHIVTLSIESCAAGEEPDFALSILQSCFLTTGLNNSYSEEVEFRVCDNKLSIGRMIHEAGLDARRKDHIIPRLRDVEWQSAPPLALDVGAPGMLDSLRFVRDEEVEEVLGDDEVEIEAAAWGLSFRDILIGLGRLGTERLGFECGGVVRRVGNQVSNYIRPGDRVVMLRLGCIRIFPRGPALTVLKLADNISFEDAVSLIAPGATAYHSLVDVARLAPGEKVLVHAGAGATGQLFIRVAQMLGAEVLATVGSMEKKCLLIKEFGIPEDHILYSRDASFAQAVRRLTSGRGVDVVVNSLSGSLLEASWSCLGPNGRFIEIGKADIRANSGLPMIGFSQNRSFAGVDLHDILLNDGQLMRRLMEKVMELAEKGLICCPTPIRTYPISQVEPAFRYIQSGKNVGRVVLTVQPGEVVPAYLVAESAWRFDSEASYLVVGGFGGLGRAIISWMASRGAKNIISMSRSGASSEAAVKLVADLARTGARLAAMRCDASSLADISTALAQCADMPPIKGCINSAMSLQDAFFENMTHAQWKTTIQSKVATSWNLHCLLPTDMDFFILMSSLAGIYGSAGQSNYAAGCTFQDALAEYRSSLGLASSISLDLGWMRTIGIVAENEEYQRVRQRTRDMQPVEEADFLALLDDYCDPARGVLHPRESQLLVGAITPAHFQDQGEASMPFLNRPIFAGLDGSSTTLDRHEGSASMHADTVELFQRAENDEQRLDVVVEALKGRLARALGVSTDDIDKREALSDYGVDSLMAVELRNWVRKDFGASVSVFEIMGGKSILEVGRLLVLRAHEGV